MHDGLCVGGTPHRQFPLLTHVVPRTEPASHLILHVVCVASGGTPQREPSAFDVTRKLKLFSFEDTCCKDCGVSVEEYGLGWSCPGFVDRFVKND